MKDIQSGDATPVNDRLFKLYNENLQKAVDSVFPASKSKALLDYHYKFSTNAAKLAAYKSAYVADMLMAAHEKDPANFAAQGKAILGRFNRYQMTEYNTLMARCRSAKQFVDFSENKTFQNLKWIRTRSANPRELHLRFAGLVLPKNDPFWRKNTPGNLYNCKCDWKLVNEMAASTTPQDVKPPMGLAGNPAITRRAFDTNHPYFNHVEKKNSVDLFLVQWVKKQFIKTKSGYGVHPLSDRGAPDWTDLNLVAGKLAKEGREVYILPRVHADNDLHDYMFYGAIGNKTPDLNIASKLVELKGFTVWSDAKLNKMISEAAKQSNAIILDLRGSIGVKLHELKRRLWLDKRITEAYVLVDDNKLYKLL